MALTAIIDLSTRAIHYVDTDPVLRKRFLGGRGLGAKILFDRVGTETGPLDPGNCLIFTTGPFSATPWPTASRYHVTFKSPATSAYGYANAGGYLGPELARAGFDALVITGQSPTPVYLLVTDRTVSIQPADDLWGQMTTTAQDRLLGVEGKTGRNGRVLCIGPAGEKRVRIAAITTTMVARRHAGDLARSWDRNDSKPFTFAHPGTRLLRRNLPPSPGAPPST